MYTYFIEAGATLKIHTPQLQDLSQVQMKTIQKADCILMQADYPGGWHIETEQYADRTILYSNGASKEPSPFCLSCLFE